MAEAAGSRIVVTLTLDQTHWRRHDRAFWAQVLAAAADEAAPEIARVEAYEMHDTVVYVRMLTRRPAKQMQKLLRDDERFLRLRSRLVDLGAQPEFEIEEGAD